MRLFVYIQFLISIDWFIHLIHSIDLNNYEIAQDRCTAIATGKLAGLDGPMTTHNADCSNCDFRINKVPAKDWADGVMRPLYVYKGDYPATITSQRGITWHPSNLQGNTEQLKAWGNESIITGYIPEVSHTFALLEAGYGIMNEYSVAIGESTCASRFWAAPTIAGGKASIEIREMSKIALERAKTAREAIQLMGDLAVTYGFYAADWSGGDLSKGEGGEGLTVIDKEEAWIFHVCADDTGTSAVWVAQRVPDDHIVVIANSFIIRDVNPNDNTNFMFSSNLWDVAERNNLWNPLMGQLDFLKTYGPPRAHGWYSTHRVWRVFNLAAPSIKLEIYTRDAYAQEYPFSVKVDHILSPKDIIDMNSDHYEGTPLDLTQGLASGPYGDPARFDIAAVDNMTLNDVLQGSYERAISMFRTSYSFVAIARNVPNILSLVWLGQYQPSCSSFIPIYVSVDKLPETFTRGSLFVYDSSILFWNHLAVNNYASRFYKFAMVDVFAKRDLLFQEAQEKILETEKFIIQLLVTNQDSSSNDEKRIINILTSTVSLITENTLKAWQDLLPYIITRYHDGYHALQLETSAIRMKKLFYPKYWLDATKYWESKPFVGNDIIYFSSKDSLINSNNQNSIVTIPVLVWSIIFTFMISMLFGMLLMILLLHQEGNTYSRVRASSFSSFVFDEDDKTNPTVENESNTLKKIPKIELIQSIPEENIRYNKNFDLLRIKNMFISSTKKYQQPHIVNPNKKDYISLEM